MRGSPQFAQYLLGEEFLKPQREHRTGLPWPDRLSRFIPITSNENSITTASANSTGGFCRAVMTLVALVVTYRICVMRFVWVRVTEALLVEKTADVSVVPVTETDKVVTLTVEVAALATVVALVTLVPIVEVVISVC